MGNLLAVVVHAANIHDTKSGILAAGKAFEKHPTIQRFCADAGYRKTFEQDVSQELGLGVDIVARTETGWQVLPKRWIVERSLAGINNSRRLSKAMKCLSVLHKLFASLLLSALYSSAFSLLVQLLRRFKKGMAKQGVSRPPSG